MKASTTILLLWCLFWQISACLNGCVHHHPIVDLFRGAGHDQVVVEAEIPAEYEVRDAHVCDGHERPSFRSERSRVLSQLEFERLATAAIDSPSSTMMTRPELGQLRFDCCGHLHLEPDRTALQRWLL